VHTTVVLTGRDATEAAFTENAPGRQVIHLATHGFFLSADCHMASTGTRGITGLVGGAAGDDVMESSPAAPIENPLLLSGLALAGANRREQAPPGEADGIVTAEEIAELDLAGVEWAVLSACNTASGTVRAGEGVFGLRRAFQVAGVRTLIMSLWSVEDLSTERWMAAFYTERIMHGLSTLDAVHDASLTMLHTRRMRRLSTHPFFWAGFIAAGDWR
jgi:CHAT domain-containing protein